MRRILVTFIAAFMLVFGSGAAFAQIDTGDLTDGIDGLDGTTVDEWTESAGVVRGAFDAFEAELETEVEAELETEIEAFRGDLDALDAAITGGDLDAIAVAADAVKASGATLVAAADAAGVDTPTVVDTGSAVDTGPSIALLAVASVLALLAGAAVALRGAVSRS